MQRNRPIFSFAKSVFNFVVDKLVRVVAVIGKDFDSVMIIEFGYGGGADSTSALSIFTLAENVKTVVMCLANKIGKP